MHISCGKHSKMRTGMSEKWLDKMHWIQFQKGCLSLFRPMTNWLPHRGCSRNAALTQAGLHAQGFLLKGVKSGDFYLLVGANPKPH